MRTNREPRRSVLPCFVASGLYAPSPDLKLANRELGTVEGIGQDGRMSLKMDGGRPEDRVAETPKQEKSQGMDIALSL